MSEEGFGRFLAKVYERDIDLLLMEEFHIDEAFVGWFCSQLDLDGVTPSGAWHSVGDTDGETDLLLRVVKGNRRIGILIENKVGAPEQEEQDRRYHLRGSRSCDQGKIDDYLTVICAPQRYLDALPLSSGYHHRVPYEAIAAWFSGFTDRRSIWRHRIVLEAIEQGRRGYTMLVDQTKTAFHMEYWDYLQRKHPQIYMARPKPKGKKSDWVVMKGHGFPKRVHMHHKIDRQIVELGFEGHDVDEVLAAKSDWPEDIVPVQRGKCASLMIRVPRIDMTVPIVDQIEAVETALTALHRLMAFASLLSPKVRST